MARPESEGRSASSQSLCSGLARTCWSRGGESGETAHHRNKLICTHPSVNWPHTPSPKYQHIIVGSYEAGDRWAPGWVAGVSPLWTDTPKWRGGGAEPCPDNRAHISHSRGQGDLPDYTRTERLLGDQKGSDVNLLIALFTRIHLG